MKKYFILFGFCIGSTIGFSQTTSAVKNAESETEKIIITKNGNNSTSSASENVSEKKPTKQSKDYTNTGVTVEPERPLPTPLKPVTATPIVDPKPN